MVKVDEMIVDNGTVFIVVLGVIMVIAVICDTILGLKNENR